MPPSTARAETIEAFHLAFVQTLLQRLAPDAIALKGGANLRYFFGSVRYSEDIDFDVVKAEGWKLEEKIDGAIASPLLEVLLRTSQISVAGISKPKQTATTQRWRLQLITPASRRPISTKIEFSRRNGDTRLEIEPVPERIVAPYALRPPTVQHYLAAPATEQKIAALAGRTETQTRDVFDLELLFRSHPDAVAAGALDESLIREAVDRCFELPFDAFEVQVLPFLEPAIAGSYASPDAWAQTQIYVAERLEELVV